ncbi:MAG: hypothetical protein LBV08_09330 [Clostridiales bacterium]|nr:hypothetical protein [Clostridiales bacterium]
MKKGSNLREERYKKYLQQREGLQKKLEALDEKSRAIEVEEKIEKFSQLESYLAESNLSFDEFIKNIDKFEKKQALDSFN